MYSKDLTLHIIIAIILVWILPDMLLIPIIAYLTSNNPYVSEIYDIIRKYVIAQSDMYLFGEGVKTEEITEVTLFVKNHYGTLKRIVKENSKNRGF